MKQWSIVMTCLLALGLRAQTDSLKRWRIGGFQADFSFIHTSFILGSQEQFRARVPGDVLLQNDVSGYDKGYGWGGNFPGHYSARIIITPPFAGKRQRLELYAGLRYGLGAQASVYYSKHDYDTLGTFTNQSTGERLYTVKESIDTYQFLISSRQIAVPLGINLTTNREKRIWLSTGLEVAPGLLFANKYTAFQDTYENELILGQNAILDRPGTYSIQHTDKVAGGRSSRSLGGVGFTGHVMLPQTVYIRFSKKNDVLKHLHFMAYLAPTMYFTSSAMTGNDLGFDANMGLGLRYQR